MTRDTVSLSLAAAFAAILATGCAAPSASEPEFAEPLNGATHLIEVRFDLPHVEPLTEPRDFAYPG